ncbi:S-layer homology domain-containing protein [Cohnella sp. GCM10027633]|uniref:S-layer homology domain-containing protein n=1 Tax=unclassified Cohnella TaxID=2636738 RepID=UPI003644BF8D
MKKKVFSLMLALLLCLPGLAANAATKTSADFSDLKDLDAATKAKFDAMISAGIFDGVSDTTFGLKDEMNRAQFAKVAALIYGLKVDDSLKTSSFSDVKSDDPANGYALPYIEAIKKAGITDGTGDGKFSPAGDVTKEQLAAFLVKGLGQKNEAEATPGVNDSTVSDWAKGYVALALELKLLKNGADGKFGGSTNATRDLLVTGAYEAKGQYVEQEKKKEEEEKKKKEEEEKKNQQPVIVSPPPTVATPIADIADETAVESGSFVELTSSTSGAAIYYTTDLSDPATSSSRQNYNADTGIEITSDVTIKAIAALSGWANSAVLTVSYTILPQVTVPTLTVISGESPTAGDTSVQLLVTASVTGTVYSVVTAIYGEAPTAAQIILGHNADDIAALANQSFVVTAEPEEELELSTATLNSAANYTVYLVVVGADNVPSDVEDINITTPAASSGGGGGGCLPGDPGYPMCGIPPIDPCIVTPIPGCPNYVDPLGFNTFNSNDESEDSEPAIFYGAPPFTLPEELFA